MKEGTTSAEILKERGEEFGVFLRETGAIQEERIVLLDGAGIVTKVMTIN